MFELIVGIYLCSKAHLLHCVLLHCRTMDPASEMLKDDSKSQQIMKTVQSRKGYVSEEVLLKVVLWCSNSRLL